MRFFMERERERENKKVLNIRNEGGEQNFMFFQTLKLERNIPSYVYFIRKIKLDIGICDGKPHT